MVRIILAITVIIAMISCNKIPNKSIFEKLTTDELAVAFKYDDTFREFYELTIDQVDDVSDVVKASYSDITYRRFFDYYKFLSDSNYWKPLKDEWELEWNNNFSLYLTKADSVLNYWRNFKEENSLDKYVKIELSSIDKEFYSFGALSDVNLGFRLTPLQGTVEQVIFTYGYKAKIYEGSSLYDKKRCLSTRTFSSPIVRFWEVGYSDRDLFAGYNAETFKRDYNIYIEVTDVRIDGKNISIDDLGIPEVVSDCFEYENEASYLYDIKKENLIKELIYSDFVAKEDFLLENYSNALKEKDEHCFNFIKEM
jgi:hypothetical protein